MKSKRLLLLLLLAIGLPWAANAQQALPYSYGFEDNNLATDGWILSGSTSSSTKIYSENDAPEGSYLFKFHYSERNAYLISPLLSGTGNGVEVTFQYMRNSSTSSYQEQFQVGYTTDENVTDPTEFTYGGTVYSGTSWLTYENSFPANTKRIAIKYIYIDGYYLRLDDFHFNLPASCPKPTNLECTAYTANTATLSWNENGEATQWELEYSTDNTFAATQTTIVSNNPTTQLTGLTAETTYYARVRALCSSTDQSDWSNVCEFKPSTALYIGNGTSTTGYAPLYGNFNNSYDQMIYTASQLNLQAAEITKIGFNSSAANSNARTITIYMGHTTKSSFSSNSDFISINDLTVVYSGTWNIAAGWNEFSLTTPFAYDGSSNLVIALYSKGSYKSTTFYYTTSSSNQVVYAYSDTNDPNPNTCEGNWGNFSSRGTTTQLPNLKLFAEVSSTPKPTNLTVSNETAQGATVSWQAPSSANPTGYEFMYKLASSSIWPSSWTNCQNQTSVDLTGLSANTTYDFRVRAVYGTDYSDPAETSFTTLPTCLVPEGLAVSNMVATWTAGTATLWNLQYKKSSDATWTSVPGLTAATYDFNNLTLDANTDYDVQVQADCGSGDLSDWTTTVTFRTPCGAITSFPWRENFESYATGDFNEPCWVNERIVDGTGTSGSLSVFKIYSGTQGTNSSKQLQLPDMKSGTQTKLVLPEMNIPSTGTYEFSIDVYRWASGTTSPQEGVRIFASTDGEIEGATELGFLYRNYEQTDGNIVTAETASGWYTYLFPLPQNTRFVILRGESYYGNASYMDNLVVKERITITADQIVNNVSDPATQMTWNEFVSHWNNGDHFTSTTFTLMEDITITEMVGTAENPFTGTFDGGGKTITATITSGEKAAASFHYIKDATIRNLTMTGSVDETTTTSDGYHAGGLVGYAWSGINTILNCRVSIDVTITTYGGGIIGHAKASTINMTGCVYDGNITNTTATTDGNSGVGGLIGWCDNGATLNLNSCVFNGTYGGDGASVLFNPVVCGTGNVNTSVGSRSTFTNVYYTLDQQGTDSGAVNVISNCGKQAYTISGESPVTVEMSGTATPYNLSGITAYADNSGLLYNGGIIAGKGDQVVLTLSGAAGYEANHGTLVANGDVFTLTMEAYDTEISAVDCPVPYNVAVPAATLAARSAQVTWTGNSDSYTIMYGEVVDDVTMYDFEDQTIPAIFTNDATYPWVIASSGHGGNYSIKSGNNGNHSTTSSIEMPVVLTSDGTLSFYCLASCESASYYWDYGIFYIDGEQQDRFLNVTEWQYKTYELAAGTHTLKWTFSKDGSGEGGDDCFYVDDITITSSAVNTWTTLPNITASSYTIENLNPETTNQVKVSGICAGVPTEYSDVVEFTTLATCPAPTELAVTDGSVTAHDATITWTENGEATTWIVEYAGNADFTDALTETVEDDATYSFDNLDGETTYYVRVKAHCGDEDESYYSNVVNFTTLVACPVPTVLTVTATTTTTATLSWTENGTATAWQICLNGDETNLIDANSNPFTLESLTAATSYTVKVRANCGGIDGESGWSNTVSFTTDCGVITTFPWSENFNSLGMANSIPNCWDNSEGTTTSDAFKWSYQGGDYLKFNSWSNSNGNTNFLKTPVLSLPNSPMQLSFRYKNPTGGDFSVYISTDGGATYTTSLFTGLTDQSDWEQKTYDLTSYAGEENVVIVFGGTSNYGSGDAYLYLDDVEITYFFTKTIVAVGEEGWANGKGGYYFIASPVAEPVTPTADNGFITDNYDLYYFSQTGDSEGNEWINFKDTENGGFSIVNGTGYLYASKEGTTLTFTGAPCSSDGEVTVTLSVAENTDNLGAVNLVGNPFAVDAYITKSFYTLENSDTYTVNTSSDAIQPMQGLLVVADEDGETLTFTPAEAPTGSKAKLNMNVSKDRSVVDQAIISFNEGQQLPKLQFRNGSTKVYIPQDGKDYAIVSTESNMGTMPVSFKAEENGTYTLSFTNEEVTFSYLHLIDNMTGIETDLLANPSYSFDARTTDYESRFKLVFATGNNANDDAFAFYSNGSFIINNEGEATLQVIDMNGRILKSESINGCANVNVKAAAGVYMFRLVNGNDVKVQKVVVK